MDIHLDYRFLGVPLVPTFSACVRRVWLATRLGTAVAAWRAHGRVRGLRDNARRLGMGARTGKELRTVGGFFFLMEVGAASEHGFKQVTVVSRCDLRLGVDNGERIAGTVGTLMIMCGPDVG